MLIVRMEQIERRFGPPFLLDSSPLAGLFGKSSSWSDDSKWHSRQSANNLCHTTGTLTRSFVLAVFRSAYRSMAWKWRTRRCHPTNFGTSLKSSLAALAVKYHQFSLLQSIVSPGTKSPRPEGSQISVFVLLGLDVIETSLCHKCSLYQPSSPQGHLPKASPRIRLSPFIGHSNAASSSAFEVSTTYPAEFLWSTFPWLVLSKSSTRNRSKLRKPWLQKSQWTAGCCSSLISFVVPPFLWFSSFLFLFLFFLLNYYHVFPNIIMFIVLLLLCLIHASIRFSLMCVS